jgi:hypothetical protein
MPATTLLASAYTVHPADSSHQLEYSNHTTTPPIGRGMQETYHDKAHETFEMCSDDPIRFRGCHHASWQSAR